MQKPQRINAESADEWQRAALNTPVEMNGEAFAANQDSDWFAIGTLAGGIRRIDLTERH